MKKTRLLVIITSIIVAISFITNSSFAQDFQDIAFMEVEELSSEIGLVSTSGKQFRLIIHHNPAYVPAEKLANFDRKKSPLLKNLQIIRRDLNRPTKNPKNIRNDFVFNLEADSSESSSYEGFLETHYLSNAQIIKKATRLNFKIELFDYLDDLQTIETKGLRTKFNTKYDIEALALEFNAMNFNGEVLFFSDKKPGKKESKIVSDVYSIEATVQTSINLSNVVKNLKFKTASDTGKKIRSKIKKDGSKGNQSHRLIPKVEQDKTSIQSTENNFYEISIPIYFESKKKLTKAQRVNIENLDLLVVPIYLDVKTGDNRDLNLSGTLRENLAIIYDDED